MQLENPKRARGLAAILASMRDTDRVGVAKRLARIERLITRQVNQDHELAISLLRVLDSPLLGNELRAKIRDIANAV
jgi:hypothetical protein